MRSTRELKRKEQTKRLAEKPMTRQRKAELMDQARSLYWTALPDLVDALIEGAKKGRVAPLKLLIELGGLERGAMAQDGATGEAKDWDAWLLAEMRRGREEAAADEVRRQETLARNRAELDEEERKAAAKQGGVDGV